MRSRRLLGSSPPRVTPQPDASATSTHVTRTATTRRAVRPRPVEWWDVRDTAPPWIPGVAAVTVAVAKEVVVVVVAGRRGSARREQTLAGQFLALQLLVVVLLLLVVGALSVRQSTADFTDEQGSR